MPRKTYPRSNERHAENANKVFARHTRTAGEAITLPVPIEMIIEQTYGLTIVWDEINEPPDAIILGALAPSDRRIVLNARHETLFDEYMGPERFTLAHELAHWIYDADDPDQLSFDLGETAKEQYCYHRESLGLSEIQRVREINANKLASHLLLPEHLVRCANINEVLKDIPGTAMKWQVSRTALRIRLQDLGLMDEEDTAQPSLM